MKCELFKRLPAAKQKERVIHLGIPLGKRDSQRFSIYLYAVYGFYVEVYFAVQSGEYESMRAFADTDKLAPYLQQIDISSLMPS